MRDLDKLLLTAFPQELGNTPSAPVHKKAVRDLTLRKLNLESPQGTASDAGAQWAVPVLRKRRPWAVLAACLVLAVMTGVGVALRPLLPSAVPLSNGTYLELAVTRAEFDQESGRMVLDLEAATDLSLSAQTEGDSYDWWMGAAFTGELGETIFRGDPKALSQLAHWEQVGEDTYRCEGLALELVPETRLSQGLHGEQEGRFSLEVTDGSENTLTAQAPFSIALPQDGPTVSFETSLQAGTHFDCSVTKAAFDPQQWAIQLTLEARTDLALSNPSAASRYQWQHALFLHTREGDRQLGVYEEASLASPFQWKEEGDHYEMVLTVPLDPAAQMEENLVGSFAGTLYLQVTDSTAGEKNPAVFQAQPEFTVTLPLNATLLSSGTEQAGPRFDCSVMGTAFDPQQWAIQLTLETRTDLALSDSSAASRYQWQHALFLHTREGDRQVGVHEGPSPASPFQWKEGGDCYETILAVPVNPITQMEENLVGDFTGTLFLQMTDSTAGEEKPVVFPAEMEFSVTLPEQTQAPAAGTGLYSAGELSPSYGQGALTMGAAVQTNMELDNPLAQHYYQWTGELTLTGSGGQSVTLPLAQSQSLQWEAVSTDPSAPYPEKDRYTTAEPLTFALSSPEYPAEEEFLAAYGLKGPVDGTLLLTCQESILGASRTWTVRIPVTVELP